MGTAVLVGPVLFGGLCLLAWAYHRYHLVQERNRAPISILEKLALVLAILVALVVFFVFLTLTVGLATLIKAIQGN